MASAAANPRSGTKKSPLGAWPWLPYDTLGSSKSQQPEHCAPLHADVPEPAQVLSAVRAAGMVRAVAVTWNMHGKPAPSNFAAMLAGVRAHIVVVGSEECERSIAASAFRPGKPDWEAALADSLGQQYYLLAAHALQATHLAVFAHVGLKHVISEVASCAVATGVGQRLGNKGGVAVRCKVGNTACLFVNCHLAAGQSNVEERNAHFDAIDAGFAKQLPAPAPAVRHYTYASQQYDRVIWMGDLNYRLDATRAQADALLHQGHASELLRLDQLHKARRAGAVLPGFHEGPVRFPPTYKFDAESDVYDTSVKARVPSWTDRILFRPGHAMALRQYLAVHALKHSDHRPVRAVLDIALGKKLAPSGTAGPGASEPPGSSSGPAPMSMSSLAEPSSGAALDAADTDGEVARPGFGTTQRRFHSSAAMLQAPGAVASAVYSDTFAAAIQHQSSRSNHTSPSASRTASAIRQLLSSSAQTSPASTPRGQQCPPWTCEDDEHYAPDARSVPGPPGADAPRRGSAPIPRAAAHGTTQSQVCALM